MHSVLDTFYAQWRVESGAIPLLRDENDSPPEALLQAIWQHQRLCRDQLVSMDGQPVRVLHPGFRNWEGGPDFHGAIVQVGEEIQTGDVEVDLRTSGWRAHGHDRNPNFRNVILHVVWDSERPALGGPVAVVLKSRLDSPLGELSLWLGGETAQAVPEPMRGRCCHHLKEITGTNLTDLLHEAARVRLQSKAARFQARAREAGWDQALWEGLFHALGYKHNVWPMQRLAELRPRWDVEQMSPMRIQARLFGLSGFLPPDLPGRGSGTDSYLRQLWDEWWRERDALVDCILPKTVWRLSGLRPANHPHRRLALGSQWLSQRDLPQRARQWCEKEIPRKRLAGSLLEVLQPGPDDFWNRHFTLRSARLAKSQPLLGGERVTDLAVNVVLPWAQARAAEKGSEEVRRRIEKRYMEWPAAQDNAILKLARQRLLGGAGPQTLTGAAAQQGLMQVVRDFCETSNALCEHCKLPAMVAAWKERGQGKA